ncbi:TPA: hypothetical protein ACIAIE_005585 [Serratia fonticola]
MSKLTKRQLEVLTIIEAGKRPHCQRCTLDILERNGLAKLHVPIGWSITAKGISIIRDAQEEAKL